MIDCFLRDAFGFFSSQFWNTVQCGAKQPILDRIVSGATGPYIPVDRLDRIVSGAIFLTGGVFDCDLAHRHSVEVL